THAAGGEADPGAGEGTGHQRGRGGKERDAQGHRGRRVYHRRRRRQRRADARRVRNQRADRAEPGREPRLVHAVGRPTTILWERLQPRTFETTDPLAKISRLKLLPQGCPTCPRTASPTPGTPRRPAAAPAPR